MRPRVRRPGFPWAPVLAVLALALAADGVRALAQAPGPAGGSPPSTSVLPDGWPQIVSALAVALLGVLHAWITSGAGAERRRADRAEAELTACRKETEAIEAELKTVERDRDVWMKRAYRQGFQSQSGDDIPTRKD